MYFNKVTTNPTYSLLSGSSAYYFDAVSLTQLSAKDFCQNIGQDLITIESSEKHSEVCKAVELG